MLSIDWRSPAVYQHAERLPAAGFAWEYLRRDDDYHRDYETLTRIEEPALRSLEAFSRRWGLRFPLRPRSPIWQSVPVLDSEASATSHPPVACRT